MSSEKSEQLVINTNSNSIIENTSPSDNENNTSPSDNEISIDSNSCTKNNEDGSPTDNELNAKLDLDIEDVERGDFVEGGDIADGFKIVGGEINCQNCEEVLREKENNKELNTDDDMNNDNSDDDKTYNNEIIHSYKDVVFYSKRKKLETSNNDQELNNLIKELKELKLYDPKVDVLFKIIFKKENIMLNLLNSFLSDEENIDALENSSEELFILPFNYNKKNKLIVDLYFTGSSQKKKSNENIKDKVNNKNKNHYVIEMQINKKDDIILRAKVAIMLVANETIKSNKKFICKKKIYSFNFVFYNIYDDDYYIHRLTDNTYKLKNREEYHEFVTYFIELRKFRKQFDIDELESLFKELDNNSGENVVDTKIEKRLNRKLWLSFLSKVNVTYQKKNKEKLKETEENKDNEENSIKETEKTKDNEENSKQNNKQKYKIYIRNDIDPRLYRLFKRNPAIMDAIKICKSTMPENVAENYYTYVKNEEDLDYANKRAEKFLKENNELNEKINNLQNEYNEIVINIQNEYNEKINNIQNECNEKINKMERENENLKQENENLKQKNENMQQEFINMKKEFINMQKEFINMQKDSNENMNKMMNEIKRLRNEEEEKEEVNPKIKVNKTK